MSDTLPPAPPLLKRKRSSQDHDRDHASSSAPRAALPLSQNAQQVVVEIPDPSSSAMAAYHATHLASSQPHSQTSSAVVETAELSTLASVSTHGFDPFLDHTTAIPLDQHDVRTQTRLDLAESSPVESFSPAEHVPRIGAWVLPELTAENSNPNPPDYTSQEVLSQIPFPIDDQDDESFVMPYSVSSQPAAPRQSIHPLQPASPVAISPVAIPMQSTPAIAPPTEAVQNGLASHANVSQQDSSSSASVAWSSLPRAEIVQLVHRSPHIPEFLKDEIQRFILRATRTSSPNTTKPTPHPDSPRPTSNPNSQPHSHSHSNDDSETQEDGVLRTKKVWYMDLLIFPHRLTPSQSSISSPSRGPIAVILLLDTVHSSFDVHELEESLASVLRSDRRYSVHFDANGRKWNLASSSSSSSSFSSSSSTSEPRRDAVGAAQHADELENAHSQLTRLQARLEAASLEIETLTSTIARLEDEVREARSQHEFVRALYDRASTSASSAQARATEAEAKLAVLEPQLTHGLAVHTAAMETSVGRWKSRVRQLEAEVEFERVQARLMQAEEVRRKAALWDAYQAQERDRETTREQRIKTNQEKRRKLAAMLGAQPEQEPQPQPQPSSNMSTVDPLDQLDELAALAAEAAEAGDSLPTTIQTSRRTRRSAATQPTPSAAEMSAHVEAATLSSTQARHDSRQDVEEQFELFSSTAQPQTTPTERHLDLGDFTAPPSSAVFNGPQPHNSRDMDAWSSLSDANLPTGFTTFTTQSLVLADELPSSTNEHDATSESVFQPHTQP